MEVSQIPQLLNDTLSSDVNVVHTATEALNRISLLPQFPLSLLFVASGGENDGQKVAAATYLKNFTRQNIKGNGPNSKVSKEFKDCLMRILLQVEPAIMKVLIEVFRIIVVAEFVEQNSWPELVPELRSAIWSSNLINNGTNYEWNTTNALTVFQALIRPFQYFLTPKVAREPVPPQLELIAKEILVPVLAIFHHLLERVLSTHGRTDLEVEKILLIVCKCIYFTVRSHMPSALVPSLPMLCQSLIGLLDSLSFDHGVTSEGGQLLRLKAGKRILLIFCALVTRHRKYSDKLMPDILNCALKIVRYTENISKLDFLSERIISLAFDLISHILETGPGWRLVSPHFSLLLDSAIFPALILNEKDISEWDEDAEEYIRKNLPFEFEEISGWREDLFTARKSAISLLGVISMSKGPHMVTSCNGSAASYKRKKGEKNRRNNRHSMGDLLVLPFLSKFPIPWDANACKASIINDYYGVLMAFGGLQEFLTEQKTGYITVLLRARVLPLYTMSVIPPYLVAAANWVLGELASCLPEDMCADIYSSLLKALEMPDNEDTSYHPVRVSAAGAIMELLENEYQPPEWLPLLQIVISRINIEDEETLILFQLLNSAVEAGDENIADHIPFMVSSLVGALLKFVRPSLDSWPQVVESGFAALAVMAKSWENFLPEEIEQIESGEKWASGQAAIGRALSALLQQTWLAPMHLVDQQGQVSPSPTCIDDLSMLLRSIMLSVTGSDVILQLRLSDLLLVWAGLIADWHAWEESEDLSVFECIKEVINVHKKYGLENFIVGQMPSPPAPPVPQQSIIEGISAFVREAVMQYPSATRRACLCVHLLLHVPCYSTETKSVKQSLAIAFSQAAFSHFKQIQSKPCSLWKPLLLVISSCYLCYPDTVEEILEKDVKGGFTIWGSALAFACTGSFEHGLEAKSEIKLGVITLAKVIERLLEQGNSGGGLLRDCFSSLMEASIQLKEAQEEMEDEESNGETEDIDEDDDNEDDDDSEDEEREETEEEFLERYAKAAIALDDDTIVEEGDMEDQEHDIEMGFFKAASSLAGPSLSSWPILSYSFPYSRPQIVSLQHVNLFPKRKSKKFGKVVDLLDYSP
ncbi:importin beta-like SAD2 isoform X3 [Manihot esculenta]|uniref:importin beta-like SAD2 isoform X3 n=1 Tax=Manihot esculenta TaxID=3983 RepID=UPI000B5D1670|nr:importin beta-like SAD2 isoform X3 [Manihot esculenta]